MEDDIRLLDRFVLTVSDAWNRCVCGIRSTVTSRWKPVTG